MRRLNSGIAFIWASIVAAVLIATSVSYLRAQPLVPYSPGGGVLVGIYVQTLTPVITSGAIQTTEQAFTVSGLTTNDRVWLTGPTPTSLCPPVTARVSAANTLQIGFSVLTAATCTPAAGSYTIVAYRLGN